MQKWKTYPEEYAGYVSDLLQSSSSYIELVEKIKELEGEQFGEENEVYITQDDIIYLLAKAKKSLFAISSIVALYWRLATSPLASKCRPTLCNAVPSFFCHPF